MNPARRVALAIAWLAVVVIIALGAAGLVTGMDAPPDGASRPELTSTGDAQVTAVLDAAEADLRGVADDVEALGVAARGALAALNGSDLATVEAAITRGDALMATIGRRSSSIRDDLANVPLIGTARGDYEVSQPVRDRHARLVDAANATTDLDGAWAQLTIGSLAASRLSAQLAAHDEAVLAAAALGRDAKYDDAAAKLDDAEAAIADARRSRDQLAKTVDVTTLDAWLDRNAAYDKALRDLYLALRDVGGRVTTKVRNAIDAEQQAKERLPPDARGLVLIMSEIGRGGMNRAVIAIEEARGRLADDLAGPVPSSSPAD
jgi:hypothetical protein